MGRTARLIEKLEDGIVEKVQQAIVMPKRVLIRWTVLIVSALCLTSLIAALIFNPGATINYKAKIPTTEHLKNKVGLCKPSKHAALNSSKLALLVEDRPQAQLTPILLHMISVVPPDWRFLFLGSKESIAFVNRSHAIQYQESIGKLEMREMDERYQVKGHEPLSVTFTSLWFYRDALGGGEWDANRGVVVKKSKDWLGRDVYVPHPESPEWLLVFQTDSILCSNSNETLNDWLEYDWVGAPWSENAKFGGNGGLSLRRISKILRVLEFQERQPSTDLEDLWLSNRLGLLPGAHMADAQKAKEFSVEAIWHKTPMGYHTGWSGARLPGGVWGEEWKKKWILEDYCPEMKMTLKMTLKT